MSSEDDKVYGLFHPYCNAGGGGERVLWQAVEDILKLNNAKVVIYTGDEEPDEEILQNVVRRFNIKLTTERVSFIRLSKRHLVDPSTWTVLTLLGQAIGSIILTYEAINLYKPDVWIDTMGYPFSYPLVYYKLNIPIVAYVHFPVISNDMLGKLNTSFTSLYGFKQYLKFIYWKIFMFLYTFVGSFVNITLTNSTWTYNHIKSIWKNNKDVSILYPPCSTEKFITQGQLKYEVWDRENTIVCLAQFRPEKRHDLIIEEYSKFLSNVEHVDVVPKLVLIGSIRNENDENYVKQLQFKAENLGIPSSKIQFILDATHEVVQKYLNTSSYGLNAMWNEHFGIAVVEYVASGLIPIVHASAGPLLDIVVPWDSKQQRQTDANTDDTRTGFFFKSETDPDYVESKGESYPRLNQVFATVSQLSDDKKMAITKRGRECVLEKFSDAKFDKDWDDSLKKIQFKTKQDFKKKK